MTDTASFRAVFPQDQLATKVAFITGGGSGIGAGIAKRFAAQGAHLALFGRTLEKLQATAKELEAMGARVQCLTGDVRNFDEVQSAVDAVIEAQGGIDIVVCAAAGNFPCPAAAMSANGFRTVIDIDLNGTFNTVRAAYETLAERRGNVISITATQATVATPMQAHVGAAKAGIEKLTRDLALEWAPVGIRLNTVAPGPVADTEGMRRLAPQGEEAFADKCVPLKRFARIEEIADAVSFLAGPTGAYITGTTILVDGGCALVGATGILDAFGA